ncbi:MAG: right-handed parallel beta-helix repeat-containing protein [Bacteroidia bacterium]|nr:right-handed parallel beta-helix repeat-containing protein [Bacteroidia bacterium]
MKNLIVVIFMACVLSSYSQTYMPLSDDMEIGSYSHIKILGGSYASPDTGLEGMIRIINRQNVVIDGDSVMADGISATGYLIKIFNSRNVIIKNFKAGKNFHYAVKVTNSKNININGCNFFGNKTDSSGTCDVWADSTASLGGGVYLANCDSVQIYNDTMNVQNDGVALYHCKHIDIHNNLFSWNTSYGIRMFWTDSCSIHDNVSAHINRPQTDPSDAAAILMIVSNENKVEHNDFTYSGDGVFLGQYQYDTIPNNNYFAYNDCSYSPHNAFEATFAKGNIYKHNLANNSWFGFWLGYSFNSVVDSNYIAYNYGPADDFGGGIAIDRGFNNAITNNTFEGNSNAIKLWEGSPISGYTNFQSHDYIIENNSFTANKIAIYNQATENMTVSNNQFVSNNTTVYLTGSCHSDSITNNDFLSGRGFYIQNTSNNLIEATGNTFEGDSAFVDCKIYDHNDATACGVVNWIPCTLIPDIFEYQNQPPSDLIENPAIWDDFLFVEDHRPTSMNWDSTIKVTGAESLHILSQSGYDVTVHYDSPYQIIPKWNLSENDTMFVWCRTIINNPNNPYGFQENFFRIGSYSCTGYGYYQYMNDCYATSTYTPCVMNSCIGGQWVKYAIPLAGNSDWVRTSSGNPDLSEINYVEVTSDVWDYGFEMWIDGLSFTSHAAGIGDVTKNEDLKIYCYPNPAGDKTMITYSLPENDHVSLTIYDSNGKEVADLADGRQTAGSYNISFNSHKLLNGVYFCRLVTGKASRISKLVILN